MYSISDSFLNFVPVSSSISSSNCYFLTHIKFSQKTGKMVWYYHFFKNSPQFVVIHMVKGFSIANEAEVDVFLEFPCSLCDLIDVGHLISGPLPFLNHPIACIYI